MVNNNNVCQALKKMTLEELVRILSSYSEMKTSNENVIEKNLEKKKKILYTIDELIEEYPFFTRYSINKAIQKCGLPYFMIGKKRMFNKEEVEKWLYKNSSVKKEKAKYEI